jgi:hypothetical protein
MQSDPLQADVTCVLYNVLYVTPDRTRDVKRSLRECYSMIHHGISSLTSALLSYFGV